MPSALGQRFHCSRHLLRFVKPADEILHCVDLPIELRLVVRLSALLSQSDTAAPDLDPLGKLHVTPMKPGSRREQLRRQLGITETRCQCFSLKKRGA